MYNYVFDKPSHLIVEGLKMLGSLICSVAHNFSPPQIIRYGILSYPDTFEYKALLFDVNQNQGTGI